MRFVAVLAVSTALLACSPPALPTAASTVDDSSATAEPSAAPCADARSFADVEASQLPDALRTSLQDFRIGERANDAVRPALNELARRFTDRCALDRVIELTKQLVAFPTVSAEKPAGESAAIDALSAHLDAWSSRTGLHYEVFGKRDVLQVELGHGKPHLAFLMHGDVVPVGKVATEVAASGDTPEGWSHPPFQATLGDERLYGRGTEDDKAPIAAVLVTMETLVSLGLQSDGKKMLAIIGMGEESNWDGMKKYAAEQPHAKNIISIDAGFPVVVAESGFVRWGLSLPAEEAGGESCARPIGVSSGKFLTQVPAKGELRVRPAGDVEAFAKRHGGRVDGEHVVIETRGKAVHSSLAEQGDNAMWKLAAVAGDLPLCNHGITTMLGFLRDNFAGDLWGQKLGLAYRHSLMGRLLVVPTVLRSEGGRVVLQVNMRRPAGKSSEVFGRELDDAFKRLKKRYPELTDDGKRYVGEPALADTSGPMVGTLMQIYADVSGDLSAKPVSIRGGTYARLFPGAVSFGPALPGAPYSGHAPDEFITTHALRLVTRATMEAALRL
jgi:dipeptidase D